MDKFIIVTLLSASLALFPQPKYENYGPISRQLHTDCQMVGLAEFTQPHIREAIMQFQQMISPNCQHNGALSRMISPDMLKLSIALGSYKQVHYLETAAEEAYELQISADLYVTINAQNHWGLVRALSTLYHLIEKTDKISTIHNVKKISNQLPLLIRDEPDYRHRGIMIDTARHYLSISTIKKTINSLMINKMNILHWHISDDESFPWQLKDITEITDSSRFYKEAIYTADDIKAVIYYAMVRGVSIVPEIDTPGHTLSWGMSEKYKDITLTCGSIPQYGQFDPTIDLTYTVLTSVMQELSDLFIDVPFVHFGGDEVVKSCWDKRPSIKAFMVEHNIADYEALETYFRQRQKQIWRTVIGNKKQIAYWYNQEVNLPSEPDDIIHWWGTTEQLSEIATKKNDIILSDYNYLYLDTGMGNAFANAYSSYHTWKDIYNWSPKPGNIQGTVIGGEACLWGETNNDGTHFLKLYPRASVLADKLWNSSVHEPFISFVARLIKMEEKLTEQGILPSPVTSDYCKRHVAECFG